MIQVSAKNNVSTRKEACFISYSFVLLKKGIHFYCLHNDNHGSTTNDDKR